MTTAKVHWIGAGNLQGWASTACGISAIICTTTKDEYKTENSGLIAAKYRDWNGVTCKRCLKNPHSPKGRLSAT